MPKSSKFGIIPLYRKLADLLSPQATFYNMDIPSEDITQT